jgi:UDP-glucose 4-epimerase
VLGAALECPSLEHVVVRSGIEIYGRRRGAPQRPAVDAPLAPSCQFGRDQLAIETLAEQVSDERDVPVTRLRFAPLVGPHFPSPLGRVLRLPTVPFHIGDPAFSLVHTEDACRVVVAAVTQRYDGALNVVADGATTAYQAARLGNRVAVPTVGFGLRVAGALAGLAGAPVPEHLVELLRRGRCAAPSDLAAALGITLQHDTTDVVKALYEWATVVPITVGIKAA